MKLKLFGFLIGIFITTASFGDPYINSPMREHWGNPSRDIDANTSIPMGFILDGGIGNSSAYYGIGARQGAVVGMVAKQIVKNGGYFCPTQIQCMAENNELYDTWTNYFTPTGFEKSGGCVWLCANNYYGDGCEKILKVDPNHCEEMALGNVKVSKKNTGDIKDDYEMFDAYFTDFNEFYSEDEMSEHNIILGIRKYGNYGFVAGPIHIKCARDYVVETKRTAWVDEMTTTGTTKLLCAYGYKPNANKTDCEPVDATICNNTDYGEFCEDYDGTQFNPDVHKVVPEGVCVNFLCKDESLGFASDTDFSCVPCFSEFRSAGRNSVTGFCMVCDMGEIFDVHKDECVNATKTLSFDDLQYGYKKDNSISIEDQCWTKSSESEYKKCVLGSDVSVTEYNSRGNSAR